MNNLPFVSIIVPVYNGEKVIGECIESLLNQDYPKDKYEIIVVDNNSKDKTAEVIKKYPVKYLLEDKIQSSYAARNTGIRNAKGEVIAFTDADCVTEKLWLISLVRFFEVNDYCVAGEVLEFPAKTFVEKFQKGTFAQKDKLLNSEYPFAPTANVAFKKEIFEKVGFFRDDLVSGGDADFTWRLSRQNYSIKFNKNACISHKNRTTVIGMYKQAKRYAFGAVCLSLEYPHMLERRKGFMVKLFNRFLFKLLIIFYRFFTFVFKKDKIYYLLEPFFMIVETYGYFTGEILGRKYIKGKKIICPNE